MDWLEGLHITHYCHRNCEPLKNIMRLPREEAFALARELARQNPGETAFGRFADFGNYYPERLEVDRRLHERFIQLGGQPGQEHPLSFVLEGSGMLDAWFGHGLALRVPLSSVPAGLVSFTYGDSMTVTKRRGSFTMLTKGMLAEAVRDHGGIGRFLENVKEEYRYMEVQVWEDGPVKKALDKPGGA